MIVKRGHCDFCGEYFQFETPVILPEGSLFTLACPECRSRK